MSPDAEPSPPAPDERHYAYGICKACGHRAAYPVSIADPFLGGAYHCMACGTRGPMIPSDPTEDERELLVKADRLLVYVPSKIAQARHEARPGVRWYWNKETGITVEGAPPGSLQGSPRQYDKPPNPQPESWPEGPRTTRGERRAFVAHKARERSQRARLARLAQHEKERTPP